MDIDLSLIATRFNNDEPEKDDYEIIWTSEDFGRQSVGRIRLATERAHRGSVWWWGVNPPLPIPGWCQGTADTLEDAKKEFRLAFEKFAQQTSHDDWVFAFRTRRES